MNERDMSLLKAVGEAVREQLSALQEKYESALSTQAKEIEALTALVKKLTKSLPDEETIVRAVLAKIEIPTVPVLPDINQMVKDAVSVIQLPESPKAPELPDIEGMVRKAVENIQIPAPVLPDINQMVKDAVFELPVPKDGKPGEDGKDALQLEIMPCIEQERSYPRGSYAQHDGGLWRAFQKTTGMKGWECLVDGISSIDISQVNEREFTILAQLASGNSTEKSFSIPVMIYRDIFKDGEKYLPGDSVTWAGSVWYCHAETSDKPGEPSSKGWKLAVKRGRDARAKT
ncbi:MAG: hypothetical protein ACRCZ6_17990 [Kluyvera sp.]|uniref:hypothetical protein n=1 Tax=Kluyvera sp. TaxID=1538228 RepID=UPI003F32DBF3